MDLKEFNEEVFFAIGKGLKIEFKDIKLLKDKSNSNERKRIRLCMHKTINDNLHEMFIIHAKDAYIRPHKHLNKIESLHVIEGIADVIIFDDVGKVIEAFRMGDYSSGYAFYHRYPDSGYHTLIIRSEFLVFHEVTSGPFKRSDTVLAQWAPDETDSAAVRDFMNGLSLGRDIGFLTLRGLKSGES